MKIQTFVIIEKAPWDATKVLELNKHQNNSKLHPYTCGMDHGKEVPLLATTNGWVCPEPGCHYTQDWCYGEKLTTIV